MIFKKHFRKSSKQCMIIKAIVGGPAGPAMAGLVFGNDIKLTSSINRPVRRGGSVGSEEPPS